MTTLLQKSSSRECAVRAVVDAPGSLWLTVGEKPNVDPTAFATTDGRGLSATTSCPPIGEDRLQFPFSPGREGVADLANGAPRDPRRALRITRTDMGLVRLKLKER